MEKLKKYLDVKSMRTPKWLNKSSIVYSHDASGVSQLWKYDLKTKETKQLSHFDNFIVGIDSHASTEQALFSMSDSGNERFQLYHYKDNSVENLTNNPEASHFIGPFLKDGDKIFFTANDRDFAHFDCYVMDLETKEKRLLVKNDDNYNFPESVSADGRYFVYRKLKAEDDQSMWIYDDVEKTTYPLTEETGKYLASTWTNDNKGFYFITNQGEEFNYCAYYHLDTKKYDVIYKEDWDVETLALSHDGKYLAVLLNVDGHSELKILDTQTHQVLNVPQPPKAEIAHYDTLDWSPNDHRLIFTLSSGTRAPNIWCLDIAADAVYRLTENNLDEEIAEKSVDAVLRHYTSFDGLKVPYWLYVPKGKKPEKLPVMIEIHGGPEAQEKSSYNEMIQYLVSEDIAVVAPNVRGSTGYGKTYSHLDDVEKRLDSVKDIESLVEHLVETGLADRDKIAVSGTSYGGFMTLSCAARYPDLFCAAVDNVGMYNLVTFLENTASYRRAHRESEYGSLETDREILYEVSPVSKVDDIKGPLMVIHGANDPRVPVSEAEQVVDYLKDKGVDVRYLRYEDEGHGLHKIENKIDCYSQMSAFLKESMGIS